MGSSRGAARFLGAAGRLAVRATAAFVVAAAPAIALAASDPGARGGPAAAGGPLDGLGVPERAFFELGREEFLEGQSVQGTLPGTEAGLGPRFNGNSCAMCHAHPATGGTSPPENPQVALAGLEGARNRVPWFVVANGPVRAARFKLRPDGTPDGGVSAIYTITGRTDAPGCVIAQPDFGRPGDGLTGQRGSPNLVFRIPTPVFGGGLVEAIPDDAVLANKRSQAVRKRALGISGRENRNANDGTISRFGWKAQNKSLLLFSGEAYNVEQGVTNQVFRDERDPTPSCHFNALPEDERRYDAATVAAGLTGLDRLTLFMRLLAPPRPAAPTPASEAGRRIFEQIGCALCHTPSLTTGLDRLAPLSNRRVDLHSDLLVHAMGTGLADGITQGGAGPDEFRTAPLWGLGQRLFFLHDGRTTDLVQAVRAHASPGSEANGVIQRLERLADEHQQQLLEFLRSL